MATAAAATKKKRAPRVRRESGVGASEGAAVLGVDPYKQALDIYLLKTGRWDGDPENDLMAFGKIMEPAIVKLYNHLRGVKLQYPFRTFRHPEHPYMLATPDAAFSDRHGAEIKSMDRWIAQAVNTDGLDDVKPDYVVQCQQQMAVMGWERVTLIALVERRFVEWEIPRNDRLIDLLAEEEAVFWQQVQDQRPPEIDETHARALKTLSRMNRRILEGKVIELSREAAEAFAEYESINAQIRDLEAKKDVLRVRYLSEIGENYAGVLPDRKRMIRRKQMEEKFVSYTKAAYIDARAVKYRDEPITAGLTTEQAQEIVDLEDDVVDIPALIDRAHNRLLAAGFLCNHRSPSGSRYYVHRRENVRVRISDHEPNAATAAWIQRANVEDYRAGPGLLDQMDILERMSTGAITENI